MLKIRLLGSTASEDKITMPEHVWLPQDDPVSSFQNFKGIQGTSITTEEQAAKA